MQSVNLDELADKVADKIMAAKRAYWVDPETHADHHDWVRAKKAGEEEFKQLRRRIILSACIWAVPIILAFIVSAIWRDVVARIVGHP
jgi:hypothetical protein